MTVAAKALVTTPNAATAASAYEYRKIEAMIPMRDGVRLYTAIYEPVGIGERPVIMRRTPYGCKPYGGEFTDNLQTDMKYFVESGYVVVYQDVRGKFESEGHFVQVRPYNSKALHGPSEGSSEIDEATDVYDTIEWLVNNVNTNGNVGITGVSYPGFYAAMGALSNHPALKAASPQAPVNDWFIGDDFKRNGVLMLYDVHKSLGRNFSIDREANLQDPWVSKYDVDAPYEYLLKLGSTSAAINDIADENTLREKFNFWDALIDHPDYDDYWDNVCPTKHYVDIKPAVMVVGGSYDGEDCFGAVKTYEAIKKQSPKTPLYFVYGPWPHGYWHRNSYESWSQTSFGPGSAEWFMKEVEFPFFDYYLDPSNTKNKVPSVTLVPSFWDNGSVWKFYQSEEIPDTEMVKYYLHEDGTTSTIKPSERRSFHEYVSDPENPVPYMPVELMGGKKLYVIQGQEFVTGRNDVCSFIAMEASDTMRICGPLRAHLCFKTDAADLDFVAKLIDVNERGEQMMIRGEIFRARYRYGYDKHVFLRPGKMEIVDFEMQMVDHLVLPGHKLLIQIQNSWFPVAELNPQTAVDNVARAAKADYCPASIKLYHDRKNPSYLLLPVAKNWK